jgi:hypothetical protein
MSTKALAILEEIQGLPPAELRELCQQINRITTEMEKLSASVSDEEFEAALNEVTGCTSGSNALQRLLEDRQRDRERDQTLVETRQREHARG